MHFSTFLAIIIKVVFTLNFFPGLWIQIDSIRIRIHQFNSIQTWIQIHKVIESGSNPDPDMDLDPQQYLRRQIFQRFKNEH
jgi:hypothetical protein